jgi:hypothetical protein
VSGITTENLDAWADALITAFEQKVVDAETGLLRLGERIAKRENAEAPDRTKRGISGRDTITVDAGRDGDISYVDVGPSPWAGIRLAHFEFGTRRQPPRPFLRRIVYEEAARWDPNQR